MNKSMIQFKIKKFDKFIIITAFLVIPIAFLLMFSYYPALKLFELSFTNWDGARPYYSYVGFKNYANVFSDSELWKAFANNGAYVIAMIFQTIAGLYLAIILDYRIKASNLLKSVIFMPYILNGVAVAFMFNFIYDYNNGPINVFLRSIGLENFTIQFFGNNYFVNFSLSAIGVWMYTGFAMVIFLSSLQTIPKELYEAASIDGARFFYSIRYITLPNIKRTLEINLFLGLNGALQAYFQPFVLTKGGPAGKSDTFVTKTLQVAFNHQNFGKASAMGVILLVIILIVISVQKLALNRGGDN